MVVISVGMGWPVDRTSPCGLQSRYSIWDRFTSLHSRLHTVIHETRRYYGHTGSVGAGSVADLGVGVTAATGRHQG